MNQTFFENWLSSWSGGKPDKLLNFYHQDIFYRDPYLIGGVQGKENFEKYLKKLLLANPNWKWSLLEFYPSAENIFTVKWRATIPTQKKEVQEEGLDIVEIKDKKIIRNEVYFDTWTWKSQL